MEQHPLQYFKDLITKGYIVKERTKFFFSQDFGKIVKMDMQNDLIECASTDAQLEDSPIEIKTITFADYLQDKATIEMINSLDQIDNRLLDFEDEKRQILFLKTIYKTFNSLILYAEQIEEVSKHPFIADLLKRLKAEIIDRYAVDDDTISQKQIHLSSSHQISNKLQWMGKSKVLISLFYDLYSNVENGGEPLIKATKDQVKNFLLNNFIEKDGQPLSPSSIDTLLTPSKEDKRALKGDRIDTSKLKDKK
ncbi:hypothetical protein PV783_29320 [Chitinophaga sp. CC14]|uniref:hypothetical protein n=1 Tax=Chitinophaga sp. CC14 TaxID=3029199 RepID=UPI003B8127B2